MKNEILLALALLLAPLAPHARAAYFRAGFDALTSGFLFPLAGNLDQTQAAFLVPVVVHDAKDGYLLVPGVDWNLLDLGYAGPVDRGGNFLHGSLAAGPSLHLGEPVKAGLRAFFAMAIPNWNEAGKYGAVKAALAPGSDSVYINLGPSVVYNLASKQVGVMGALTINRTFGQ